MSATITVDELLAEYARLAEPRNDPGLTAKELSAIWGLRERQTRLRIQSLVKGGALRAGTKTISDITGRPNRVPVYELVKKGKR